MPGVIDSLVLQLGLDSSALVKGSKEVVSSVEKTKTEVVKHGTAIESAVTKAANSFEGLAGKALAAFAIFAGAKSVEQFTRQITTLDAAVGRLSASFGQAPEDVDAIGKAVERMGGSADTAMSGLRNLSDAFEQFRTTGTTAVLEPIARLQALSGKAVQFGADVKANFLSIADALKALDDKGQHTQAHFLGRQLLGSDDLTNLAIQGGAAAQAAMAQSARRGVLSPADVEAAKKLQEAFVGVSQTVVNIGTKIETALTPYLTKLLGQLDEWLLKNKDGLVAQIQKAVEDFGKAVAEHGPEIKAFGDEILAVVTAAGDLAKALSSEGALGVALAGIGALALTQVAGPLATLARTMAALGLLNPAVLGTLGIGAVLASGDPNKAVLSGGHPDVQPQDNDLGLPGVGDRPVDTGDAKGKAAGAWDWIKTKLGLGGQSGKDDARAREAAVETAEGVKTLVKQGERATIGTADGMQGVTASSGGLGGSGRHFGGGNSPGASLRDRGQAGRGAGPSALRNGQQKANAAAIAEEMRKAGMSDEGIAAVLGSMQTESGFSPRAHNDVAGGHTGLWQWDARRWTKVRGWIEKQGGDPWDARWQAKAFIAEGRAKPGDAIYDNGNTSGGFDDIMGSKGNLPKAVHGVQRSERFGVGEEGGRAANAGKWLGHLPTAADVPGAGAGTPAPSGPAITDADVFAARQRIVNGSRDPKDKAIVDAYIKQQNAPKKTSFLDGLGRQAPMHVASLAAGAQMATHRANVTTTHHNDNSSETHIGTINVQTAATDAGGIATDIGPALKRGQRAANSQYGLG